MATLSSFGQTTQVDPRGNVVAASPTPQTFTNNQNAGSASYANSIYPTSTVQSYKQSPPPNLNAQNGQSGADYFKQNPTANPTANPNYNPADYTADIHDVGPAPGQSWTGGPGSTQFTPPSAAPAYVGQQALAGQVRIADQELKAAQDKIAKGFQIDPASAAYMSKEQKDALTNNFNLQAKAELDAATAKVNALQVEQNRQAQAALTATTPVPGAAPAAGQQGTTTNAPSVPPPVAPPVPGVAQNPAGMPSWIGTTAPKAAGSAPTHTGTPQGTPQGTPSPSGGAQGASPSPGAPTQPTPQGQSGTTAPTAPPPTPQQTADYTTAMQQTSGLTGYAAIAAQSIIDAAQRASVTNGTTLAMELANIQTNKEYTKLIAAQGQKIAGDSANTQIGIEKSVAEQAKNRENEVQRQQLASLQDSQAMQRANYGYQEQQQRQTNIQTEIQDRAYLLSTGQATNSSGLEWQNRQVQKGTEAMNYILTQAANSEQKYGNDQIAIVNNYANAMNDIDAKQLNDTQTIFSNYNKTINDLRNTEIADTEKQNEMEQTAYKGYNDALTANDFKVGDAMKSAAEMMQTQNLALTRITFDKQQAAISTLKDIWTSTGGQYTPALQSAAQAAKDAGVSPDRISGFMTGQLTLQGLTNNYQAKAYQYSDPNYWPDQPSKDVMSLLGGVNFLNNNDRLNAINDVGSMLSSGNVDVAKNKVINYAMKTMTPADQTKVSDSTQILRNIDNLQSFMDTNKDVLQSTGVYQKNFQDLKKYAGDSQNPILRQFYAQLTAINATELHEKYGARLTETEIAFGNSFLGQTNEPIDNVISKVGILRKDISGQVDQYVQTGLGMGNTYLNNAAGGQSNGSTNSSGGGGKIFNNDYFQNLLHPSTGAGSGYRTDRNNNPTAMTTGVASSMGLQQGIDYSTGDSFQGDPDPKTGVRPTYNTAKLIGDPIATTIKAIDQGGLTTKSGSPRWTYLDKIGLTDALWKSSTPDQKKSYIKQMYEQEGGSGKLFNNLT